MKNKNRFVFDANVLVSALLFKASKPRRAFDKAIEQGNIVISIPVLLELNKVLSYNKLNKYLIEDELNVCRDPDDNKYLELAVASDAQFIITGDNDLLTLNPFRKTKIVTPDQFLSFDLE